MRAGMRAGTRAEPNEGDGSEEDTVTCCDRATFCSPLIRKINVTDTIITCFGRRIIWANLFWMATTAILILIVWTVLFFLLGETMLPSGSSFGLFALITFSYMFGWALTYLPYLNLPPIFGMLLAGIIVRNANLYNIYEELGIDASSKIRTVCLTFIMIRAGLQLTTTALRTHPYFVMILAVVPCSIEMMLLGMCCRYILQYPWDWSFMTGAIVACMSPVVTVNCVLALAEQGYGEDRGFATLLCTAASIDDVHIVSLFSICYSRVFANDQAETAWWSFLPVGLRDLSLGVLAGATLGLILVFFPHRSHKYAVWYRILALIFGSLMCTTGALKIAISGGGFLATIILSFTAITGWRILSVSLDTIPLQKAMYIFWHLTQPVLVGVIGADIDLKDWSFARCGLHLATIGLGITTRAIATILTTVGTSFTWKERIFVAIAWLPKGTLQAALAPMAFEHAKRDDDPKKLKLALDASRLSVLAILLMAPLGAMAMMNTGPALLNKITADQYQRNRAMSYSNIVSLQPVRSHRETVEQTI